MNFTPVDFLHWPYPPIVAHRGAGKLAPENTLAALRLGASLGQTMFEFDVKLTADGKPILLHDALLDRTTNGQGLASVLTLAEISQLDAGSWLSAQWAGEPVPTLSNIIRWLRANSLMANIEIKPTPGQEAQTGAAVAIVAAHAWQGQGVPPLLSSFSEVALEAALKAVPQLPRALLLHHLPEDWLARLKALQCVGLDAHHEALSPEVVSLARSEGFRVLTYTVNDPARAALLREWGVDVVITDAVDRIKPGNPAGAPI